MSRRPCELCGEIFDINYQRLCDECTEQQRVLDVPEPEYKGDCVCWYDGFDYQIHQCDNRRKIARERRAQKKSYLMPQCAVCTPGKAIVEKPEQDEKRCGWCQKGFEGRANQVYCSNTCQGKRRRHSDKLRRLAKEKKNG